VSPARRSRPFGLALSLLLRGLIALTVALVERQLRKALAKRPERRVGGA
jgi:hypothetical protein